MIAVLGLFGATARTAPSDRLSENECGPNSQVAQSNAATR